MIYLFIQGEETAGKYVRQLEIILLISSLGGVCHFRIYLSGIIMINYIYQVSSDLDKEFPILGDSGIKLT